MNVALINERKEKLNLTNKDIALQTGISLSTISKICSGNLKTTSKENLFKLSNILDCSIEDLESSNFIEINHKHSKEKEIRKIIIDQYGSLSKFAESVDMTLSTISRILREGLDSATFEKISTIFKRLNLSFDDLIYFNEISFVQSKTDLERDISENLKYLNSLGLSKVCDYIDDINKIKKYREIYTRRELNEIIHFHNKHKDIDPEMFEKSLQKWRGRTVTRRARNDFENNDEEQELMEEDFEMMKRLKDKSKL